MPRPKQQRPDRMYSFGSLVSDWREKDSRTNVSQMPPGSPLHGTLLIVNIFDAHTTIDWNSIACPACEL